MYYPVGWPKKLNFRCRKIEHHVNGISSDSDHHTDTPDLDIVDEESETEAIQVVANTDRTLFVILTKSSVHVWFCKVSFNLSHLIEHALIFNNYH